MKRISMIMSIAFMFATMWLLSTMPSAYAQDIWVGRDAAIHDCDVYLDTEQSSWNKGDTHAEYIGKLKWVADDWVEKVDYVTFFYVKTGVKGGHYVYRMKSEKKHRGSVEEASEYIKNTFAILKNNRKKIKETKR